MIVERRGYYDKEFEYLKLLKNQEIICIYWDFGKLKGFKGKLDEINAYDFIIIEGKKIKFLGERTAIKCILSSEEIIVYYNQNIEDYTGRVGHFHNLISMQNKYLGYSVIEEKLDQIRNNVKYKRL